MLLLFSTASCFSLATYLNLVRPVDVVSFLLPKLTPCQRMGGLNSRFAVKTNAAGSPKGRATGLTYRTIHSSLLRVCLVLSSDPADNAAVWSSCLSLFPPFFTPRLWRSPHTSQNYRLCSSRARLTLSADLRSTLTPTFSTTGYACVMSMRRYESRVFDRVSRRPTPNPPPIPFHVSADSLAVHFQFVHDGHFPCRSGHDDPDAHAAEGLCSLQQGRRAG